MKSLREALVHKHMDQNKFQVRNPKLDDLEHLDILETEGGEFYICLQYNACPYDVKECIKNWGDDIEAYTYDKYDCIADLGLVFRYNSDLTAKHRILGDDISSVYRGVLKGVKYKTFMDLWDEMKKRLKEYRIAEIPK